MRKSYIPAAKRKAAELLAAETALPHLLAQSITYAAADVGKGREIASTAATIANILPVRDWAAGMVTKPGELVYDPKRDYEYMYTGEAPMTHANPTFYPGASGVYYWAIVPKLHEGIKVYPNITGIIVAVEQGEIWWNRDKTKKYRWNAANWNACNRYPGEAGVHQWVAE